VFSFSPLKVQVLKLNFNLYLLADTNHPLQFLWNAMESGDIMKILQLSESFYEVLIQVWKDEDWEEIPSVNEIVLDLMKNNFQTCREDSMKTAEILNSVGFEKDFSKDFADHIEEDPLDMSLWDWIRHFVNSTLDHLLMKPLHFPTDGLTVYRNYDGYSGKSDSERKKIFKRINFNNQDPNEIQVKLANEMGVNDEEKIVFFYHATSPVYADSIITNGIRLEKGKPCAHFSHQDGFYLTPNLLYAIRSAYRKACRKFSKLQNLNLQNYKRENFELEDLKLEKLELENLKHENLKRYKQANEEIKLEDIAIVVFAYSTDSKECDPLMKYKEPEPKRNGEQSIDLRGEGDTVRERLEKIVYFFSTGESDSADTNVSMRKHGLYRDYRDKVQYIIGPHTYYPKDNEKKKKEELKTDKKIVQLCLRRPQIKADFENIMNAISVLVSKEQCHEIFGNEKLNIRQNYNVYKRILDLSKMNQERLKKLEDSYGNSQGEKFRSLKLIK